jgi:hypothetical protein
MRKPIFTASTSPLSALANFALGALAVAAIVSAMLSAGIGLYLNSHPDKVLRAELHELSKRGL